MARLPEPILDTLMVEWPGKLEDKKRRKEFASILGQGVRKYEAKKTKEGDKDEG